MSKTIHTLRTAHDEWMSVFCGDLTFQIRNNDRDFKVGDWLDLKRTDQDDNMNPMFAVDGVEVQLWVKVTAITRGDQFTVSDPDRARTAARPLDPRFVVLALKRI